MNSTKVWAFAAVVLTGVCGWLGYLIMEQEGIGPFASDDVQIETQDAKASAPASSLAQPEEVKTIDEELSSGNVAEERKSEMRNGTLYLEGTVDSEENSAFFEALGVAILGDEDKVVNNYEIDEEITTNLKDDFTVAVVSPNIFEAGITEIDPDATIPSLEALVKFLEFSDTLEVEIYAYTDTQRAESKPEDQNQQLAIARADAVEEWLIDQGVAADRISKNPVGETEQFGKNDTPEGREANRRIVFQFSKLTPPEGFLESLQSAEGKETADSAAGEKQEANASSTTEKSDEETTTTE